MEQIIGIVKQYEGGRPAKELCRQYGFSDQTLKRWKAKYKGMAVGEARRLKAPEDENRRLKRGEDKELRVRLRFRAARRPRWGYRLLHRQLGEEGLRVDRKKVLRLYREEGLRIRRRRRRHVAAAPREKLTAPTRANERWSMDFAADEVEDGRSLRVLNVVDDFTRQCLGNEVDRSLPAERVTALLERIAKGARTRGRAREDRALAAALQHAAAAQLAREPPARGVRPQSPCPAPGARVGWAVPAL